MTETEGGPGLASLEGIPGLDCDLGLRTVGGRTESLVRLLVKYEAIHAGDGARLRAACREGRREEVRDLAHSLKGAAGFLGLVHIQSAAADLEAAFKGEGDPLRDSAQVEQFDAVNQASCRAIRDRLAG